MAVNPDFALETVALDRGDARLHLVCSRLADPHERRAPVLFLHGYPDTHATWSRQLEGLAPMHPIAAYDMRGVGGSTMPVAAHEGTRIGRYLDDIEAVIDHVAGPDGQVHLVGHDWGGVLGWQFASDPARARRLRSFSAIAAPHPGAAMSMLRERLRRHRLADLALLLEQLRRSWYIFLFQLPAIPELYLGRDPQGIWIGGHRDGGMLPDDPELVDVDPEMARRALLTPLALYRQMFRATVAPPRTIAVPVCLIVPLRDMALTPELYDTVPEFVPDLEQHRIDDNHWVHRTRSAEVNQILHDFIARHER